VLVNLYNALSVGGFLPKVLLNFAQKGVKESLFFRNLQVNFRIFFDPQLYERGLGLVEFIFWNFELI
jgi:hypothetical protein